jgi:hypothetical protein
MKIILTQIQYLHLIGSLERHGWKQIVGNFPITSIRFEMDPPDYDPDQFSFPIYSVTISYHDMTIERLQEFLQHIKNI